MHRERVSMFSIGKGTIIFAGVKGSIFSAGRKGIMCFPQRVRRQYFLQGIRE